MLHVRIRDMISPRAASLPHLCTDEWICGYIVSGVNLETTGGVYRGAQILVAAAFSHSQCTLPHPRTNQCGSASLTKGSFPRAMIYLTNRISLPYSNSHLSFGLFAWHRRSEPSYYSPGRDPNEKTNRTRINDPERRTSVSLRDYLSSFKSRR
jgi:hypothetical protein